MVVERWAVDVCAGLKERPMMPKAIIFDIDNTLLAYPQSSEAFGRRASERLIGFFAQWISPEKMAPALMRGQRAMDANPGSGSTNAQVFFDTFCPAVGYGPQEARDLFDRFYLDELTKLRDLTHPMPGARSVVEWAFETGRQVAIATAVQSTSTLVDLRLAWAGVPATEFDYAFTTTIDNMHASKPHVGYYHEVVQHLGRRPDECLMVGDSWTDDIVPATRIGIGGYWITDTANGLPDSIERLFGHGTMLDLLALLRG
jgi:FMN phosphatase YigB (HAD superfamily)